MILTLVPCQSWVSEHNAPTIHTLQQIIHPTNCYINNMNQQVFFSILNPMVDLNQHYNDNSTIV